MQERVSSEVVEGPKWHPVEQAGTADGQPLLGQERTR